MKYKTRHLLSGILSICLAFIVTISGIELSGFQPEFNVNVEAGLSSDYQGSLLGGAEIVDVKLGAGNGQWIMEYEPLLYVTWAKADAGELSNANEFFVKQVNEGGFADRWVYDTSLSWGDPAHTGAYGLLLTANAYYQNAFVCNIGSSSMSSYIPFISKAHMSSPYFLCSDTVASQVRNLLKMYYTGTGNGQGLVSQKQIMPNTADGLCAIYTLLYKYGGMPLEYYEEALEYTKNGSGTVGYSIISTIVGFPADLAAITYKNEPTNPSNCNCTDPANHDASKAAVHRNWLKGVVSGAQSVKNVNGSSYLLQRVKDEDKKNSSGQNVTKFKVTWADVIPVWLKAGYPTIDQTEYTNLFKSSGYDGVPLLVTCTEVLRMCGQNINTGTSNNPLKFIEAGDYLSAKSNYWSGLNALVPQRNISNLPAVETSIVAKPKEYVVEQTPLDADGNPILDMNGKPIVIPPYNHYKKDDYTEYVTGEYVNGMQITAVGTIPTTITYDSKYTPASALTVFNNNNRWPYVYKDSEGNVKAAVDETVMVEGVTNLKALLFGTDNNFYTGYGNIMCNFAQRWFEQYCIAPSVRAQGSNMDDTAFANVISYKDSSGNTHYHFGHSYLTTAGSGLQFDISGYEKGQLINVEAGKTATFEPHYDIRLHAKSEEDLYSIDTSHNYTMTISIRSDYGKTIQNMSSSPSVSVKSLTGSVTSTTVTLNGSTLQNMFRTPETPIATINGNPITVSYPGGEAVTITVPIAVKITIEDTTSGLSETLSAVSYTKDEYDGFKSKSMDNKPWGSNYASCTVGQIDRVPWGQNSSSSPSAYAEIVANEVGNQDWNVLQGIPSTENLSISAGGDAFLVGYSGWTYRIGTACGRTYTNAGVGEAMPSAGLTRTITINTTIKDIWGPADYNVPCSLSCKGTHEYTCCTHTGEMTCPCTGGTKCKYCGAGISCNPVPHGEDEEGNPTDVYCDGVSSSCGHSGSVVFNCQTGVWTATGDVELVGPSSSPISSNQRFNGSTGWKCTHSMNKGDGTQTHTDTSVIDQGYTTGYGCECSENANHQHEYNSYDTFHVYEYVDAWYYRQLKNVRLYGLSKSYVKEINTSVLNTGLNQSAACVGLKACIWRAGESSGLGKYENGNGRIWFQQFSNPTYSSGGGWSTTIGGAGSGKTYDYWLGDCTVSITAYADRAAYLGQAWSDTDIGVFNMSVRSNAGSADGHTGSISPTSSNSEWQSGKYATGDWLNSDEIAYYHLKLANTWQNKNNIDYVITSVSDTMALAVNDGYAENITGSVYNITNNGSAVKLFDYPFTTSNHSHYRCFVNPLGNTLTADGGGNVLQSSQPTMKVGFVGAINQVATGAGQAYNSTLAYGLATGSITPGSYGGTGGSASGSECYKGKIDITESSKSGYTSWELVNTNSSNNAQSFNGYWDKHDYPNTGSYSYVWKRNGNTVAGTEVTTTNSGQGNLSTYNNQLVISNVDILGSAKNGSYIPCAVYNTYVPLANYVPDQSHPTLTLIERATEYKAGFTGVDTDINNVIIHDPVSVQHCEVISNGAGAYASGVVDESGEDMRTSTAGKAEEAKVDYVVIGNTIHIAYSDIGDFYSETGTEMTGASPAYSVGVGDTGDGCNPDTGSKNAARGYVNNMNCSTWVKERYVKFPFPVSYIDKDNKRVVAAAEKYIPLSNVMGIGATGNKGYYDKGYATGDTVKGATTVHGTSDLFHTMSNSVLNKFETNGRQYYYGLDYEFTCLTSAVEAQYAKIEFLTTAVNDVDTTTNDNPSDHTNEEHLPKKNGLEWAAESTVRKQVDIDIVGRIGNLTINDTGDFRFSNLFKATTSGYLIPGVVKNTDYKTPNSIISTRLDILGNLVSNNLTPFRKVESTYTLPSLGVVTNHSTLSVSNYRGTLGKAGSFYEFPLTAGINNIPEFTNEQLRLGYDILMDVETLGNYYGINYKNGAAYYGPTSVDELNSDTRTNVVTIVPHYYLYSPSLKKYVNIDIYSGVEGNRKLLWTDSIAITGNSASSLYVDLAKETYRRNVDEEELAVTETVLSSIDSSNLSFKVSADESDFIGTNTKIVLDAKNRTFIGSNVLYGDYEISGNQMSTSSGWSQTTSKVISLLYQASSPETLIDDTDFLMRSQRYHFALGLPSSTYITECGLSNPNQNDIEKSHDKLKSAYPDGVIVCMLEIYAKDEVWELAYNENLTQGISGLSNEQSKVYLSSGEKLDDTSDDIYLYRPGKGATYDGTNINPKWALTAVMDAWHTSAQDLETYGTH